MNLKRIGNDKRCVLHCRQNAVLYVNSKSDKLNYFEDIISRPIDMVHPEMMESILGVI